MINPLWPRWIESSILKYLTTEIVSAGYNVRTSVEAWDDTPSKKYVQIVLNGPNFRRTSPTKYEVLVTVNLLIEAEVTTDIYESADIVGTCISLLESIPVFNYGQTGPTQQGCLTPVEDSTARDWTSKDGGVADGLNIHQRSVETDLTMELTNG